MKNFHVRNDQCDSIIFLETFSLGTSKKLLDLPLVTTGFFLQILELHALLYLFVRTSNKQQRRDGIISNFTKWGTFFIPFNNQVLLRVFLKCSPSYCTLQKRPSFPFSLAMIIYLSTHLRYTSIFPIPTGRVERGWLTLC